METSVFAQRRRSLQEELSRRGIAAALISDRVDQIYFSGTMQSNFIIIPADKGAFHLTRKAVDRVGRESQGMPVYLFGSGLDIKSILAENGLSGRVRIGINPEALTAVGFVYWQRMLSEAIWEDISPLLKRRRKLKEEWELDNLRKAGEVLRDIPKWAMAALKDGKTTELALGVALEARLRLKGHGGFVRLGQTERESVFGVIASGTRPQMGTRFEEICAGTGLDPSVPFGPGRRRIEPGEPIFMDYIMNYHGYHADQTRMICYGKNPPAIARRAYEDMLEILGMLEKELKPGARPAELYAMAEEEAKRRKWADSFMGFGAEKVGCIGHGVGLTLDEEPYIAPDSHEHLQAGMALALEPKVMLRGIGVVGIEDTYVITNTGAERVTLAHREWRTVITNLKAVKASG